MLGHEFFAYKNSKSINEKFWIQNFYLENCFFDWTFRKFLCGIFVLVRKVYKKGNTLTPPPLPEIGNLFSKCQFLV